MVRSLPKTPWALQTLLLIFAWCSYHSFSSPSSPSFTSLPIVLLLWWCFCRGCVSGELGSFIMGRESMASGYRSEVTVTHEETDPYSEWHKASSAFDRIIQREGYKECDSRKEGGYKKRVRQTQTVSVPLGEHMIQTHCCFKHFPL